MLPFQQVEDFPVGLPYLGEVPLNIDACHAVCSTAFGKSFGPLLVSFLGNFSGRFGNKKGGFDKSLRKIGNQDLKPKPPINQIITLPMKQKTSFSLIWLQR